MMLYCFIYAAPHFIYGPGDEALSLTEEYGAIKDHEHSKALQEMKDKKLLCRTNCKKFKILFFVDNDEI